MPSPAAPETPRSTVPPFVGNGPSHSAIPGPDALAVPGFLRRIRRYGHLDANGCLNCGSCTIVCDLSSDSASFPRRPIQYAILGLEGPLRGSLEPWLCHDCRDCSTPCPRDADPGEAMATIRRYLVGQYDFTGLASRICRSTAWRIGALTFTALLVLAIAYGYHLWKTGMTTAELVTVPMGLEHMFPKIATFTWIVFLLPLLFLFVGALRMRHFAMEGTNVPPRAYAAELQTFFAHLVSHRKMRACPAEQREKRWLPHWLLAFAFAAMAVILVFALKWFQTDAILPLYHPQRWIGYLITAVMLFVPAAILLRRARGRPPNHRFSGREDLALPILLLLTALSGIAVHVFRYLDLVLTCHFAYAVHLAIAGPLLVIEVPFGKLSHVVYRPLAIYLQAVKDRAGERSGAGLAVVPAPPAPEEARVA